MLESWNNKKVLVTGGNGFLGSHLCSKLRQFGADVHATSRQNRLSNSIMWHQTDLSSLQETQSIIDQINPNVIYHFAGETSGSQDLSLVTSTFESLLQSTINVLLVAHKLKNCKVILAGSLNSIPINSQTPPSSPYAIAKYAASAYGRMFNLLYDLPVVIVVPFMTFGPAQNPNKLISSTIISLLKNEMPKISSGKWESDWIFVDDVINSFILAGSVPGIEGYSFQIGTGIKRSVQEIVLQIVKQMKSPIQPVFGALLDRKSEPESRVADITEARDKLGWFPTTSFEDGLQKTINWYTSHE